MTHITHAHEFMNHDIIVIITCDFFNGVCGAWKKWMIKVQQRQRSIAFCCDLFGTLFNRFFAQFILVCDMSAANANGCTMYLHHYVTTHLYGRLVHETEFIYFYVHSNGSHKRARDFIARVCNDSPLRKWYTYINGVSRACHKNMIMGLSW